MTKQVLRPSTYAKEDRECIHCKAIFKGTKKAIYCQKCRVNSARLKKKA